MAVVHLFGPVSAFYRFWRISFADFVASMACFWVTIFVSAEIGIGCAAAWSVVWTMLRSAFVKPTVHTTTEDGEATLTPAHNRIGSVSSTSRVENVGTTIPNDTVVIQFSDSIFYPNAHRSKGVALEAIKLVYDKVADHLITEERERSWSVASDRRVERLRKEQNIVLKDTPLSVVVWDFTMVSFIDMTAILALGELKQDIRLYAGKEVQFHIVGMSRSVRERFMRASWKLVTPEEWRENEFVDVVYSSMEKAIWDREGRTVLEGVSTTEKVG